MSYEMEELVPIVARLAEGFTSMESTSIPYERAQQLMEAVLYCIREGEQTASFSVMQSGRLSPQLCYELGVACVQDKVRETLKQYNRLMTQFSDYGNRCLYDTVVKGFPEFFKWYDWKYEPQNTILTLDYPILMDLSEKVGIDRIYDYLLCIELEQRFLNRFPVSFVTEVLSKYNPEYRLMIENLCEIVLMNVMLHIMAEKEVIFMQLDAQDYLKIQVVLQREDLSSLRQKLSNALKHFIHAYYDDDEQLAEYLRKGIENICVRMKVGHH